MPNSEAYFCQVSWTKRCSEMWMPSDDFLINLSKLLIKTFLHYFSSWKSVNFFFFVHGNGCCISDYYMEAKAVFLIPEVVKGESTDRTAIKYWFSLSQFTCIVGSFRSLAQLFLSSCTRQAWHSGHVGELVHEGVVVLLWHLSPAEDNSGSVYGETWCKIMTSLCLMFVFC